MKLEQSFSYTGGSEYTVNNVNADETTVSLFDKITGVGGVDYVPYDGSTVTVKTGRIDSSSEIKKLEPSLNNKVYYLVSDVAYTEDDKQTIISLATEIPVYLNAGTQQYEGEFVFNNPNDYPYLYLIWDYSDNMSSGFASYYGDAATKYIDIDYGTDIGSAGIRYNNTGKPSRFLIKWNGIIVADTGYVGVNSTTNYDDLIAAGVSEDDIKLVTPLDGLVDNGSGDLLFGKTLSDINEAQMAVYSPLDSSSWDLERLMPSLNSFYIGLTNGTVGNVCTQTATTNYYHNGVGVLPTVGDTIYTVSDGSVAYNGANAYHLISDVSLSPAPVSGGKYVAVNEFGVVILAGNCDCTEATVPYIYTTDINLVVGRIFDLKIGSNGNPTSWTLSGSCNQYVLTGGTKGSIFSYTDCDGVVRNETVGAYKEFTICTTGTPSLTYGDGVATLGDVCIDYTLPKGVSFDKTTGILSGTPVNPSLTTLTLTATNCKGTSSTRTINITVEPSESIKPFAIDVENFGDTGDAACVVTPVYSIQYHDGSGRVPKVGDTIYRDSSALEYFNGGDMWYKIDHSTYTVQISTSGVVSYKNECPVSTTTTTTTSTTTTTTTLPAGGSWHTAYLCNDPFVFARLYDSTGTVIANNSIIKTTDGNCWKKTTTTTAGYPYMTIENPVVVYANCNTCRGVTTTTTTTTTTTAPVITAFQLQDNNEVSAYLACLNYAETLSTYYHDGAGAKPVVGDKIYEDALGTIPFDGNGYWYYMPNTSDYAIRIDNTGNVLNVDNCSGITTTTTTTTASVTRYLGEACSGSPAGNFALEYPSSTLLEVGQVVKDENGDCFTITTVSPATIIWDEVVAYRSGYTIIYFLYENCTDCQGVTTTTTTTTSTTTTTTTSTTTTTTTTLPPLTSIIVRRNESLSLVCSGDIVTRYINLAIGEAGSKLYKWNGTTYVEDDLCYVVQLGTSSIYRWIPETHSFSSFGSCS